MPTVPVIRSADITALILAGGRARRMGGIDKGLLSFRGKPLIEHVIAAVEAQAGTILISANRNLARYRAYGYPVVTDGTDNYDGPLAGIARGMQAATTPYLLCVPCDAPFVPATLVTALSHTLAAQQADICAAHDGIRLQPLFALLRRELLPALRDWLASGGRRVDSWYGLQQLAYADCSACPEAFANLNTADDTRRYAATASGQQATGS